MCEHYHLDRTCDLCGQTKRTVTFADDPCAEGKIKGFNKCAKGVSIVTRQEMGRCDLCAKAVVVHENFRRKQAERYGSN